MAKIVIFAKKKGGAGATTLATNYAVHTGAHYYTNDEENGTREVFINRITHDRFHLIKPEDDGIDFYDHMVFDFGGFVDTKLAHILRLPNGLCVVPVMAQSKTDLRSFFRFMAAISKITDNILIVINNTESKYINDLKDAIEHEYIGKYPIKIVKRSSFMNYLADYELTPFELEQSTDPSVRVGGAVKKALKNFNESLENLFTFIREY